MASTDRRNIFFAARRALAHHATGGNVLMCATVLALVAANVPGLRELYGSFWTQEMRLQIGSFNLFSHGGHPMTVIQFINDALMAIFFFNIGLEIKREVLVGELSSLRQALLPVAGAIGGMLVPVGIFWLLARDTPYAGGAAIPMATDIAFSLGIMAMLGARVPVALKIFLTTLAVVDDIGGIIVIAACYSDHIDMSLLAYAAVGLLVLVAGGGWLRIQSKMFYFMAGGVVWFLVLNSGIHPTIAGVLVALCVPASPVYAPGKYIRIIRDTIGNFRESDDGVTDGNGTAMLSHEQLDWLKEIESASDRVISPLQDMEDQLHPLTDYLIIPLFAFANAGISLSGVGVADVVSGLSLAIIIGLVVGKFAGIFAFSWLTVKAGLAPMPSGTDWRMIAAVSLLGGIGFTVSLFIADLTFDGGDMVQALMLDRAKLGIMAGSLIAGLGGYLWLRSVVSSGKAHGGVEQREGERED